MIFFDKVKDDGYIEELAAFSGCGPNFRLRAVLQSTGKYVAVLRHLNPGIMISISGQSFDNPEDAFKEARKLLIEYLQLNIDNILKCVA